MSEIIKLEPIRKTLHVDAKVERAFQVFTERIGEWWPLLTHHIGKAPAQTAVIEPWVDGRWYERGIDGSECNWGKVLVWEPPARIVLAWQISAQWQYDPALLTEVEVLFVAESAGRTRVEVEHRKLEAFGTAASELRKSLDGGWPGILDRFAQRASAL
jgi:uncharacterized protein YndB with AHSA1/START domain